MRRDPQYFRPLSAKPFQGEVLSQEVAANTQLAIHGGRLIGNIGHVLDGFNRGAIHFCSAT
jgi:hypothetical protein